MSPGWMHQAACRGMGPYPFFGPEIEHRGEQARRVAEAKAVCAGCLVRGPCLNYVLAWPAQVGFAAGMTAAERDAERRRRMRRAS
jgi:WhiB family redox-sensing transcriptional regulator